MKACILIKTKPGRHNLVSKTVSTMKGMKDVFPVLGRTDVVARVEVTDLKDLSTLSLNIGKVDGVTATETLIALEV